MISAFLREVNQFFSPRQIPVHLPASVVADHRVNENVDLEDRFSKLPEAWIVRVFSYLSASGLANAAGVNKQCNKCSSGDALWSAFDMSKISPRLHVINGASWIAIFGVDRLAGLGVSVDDEPRLNQRQAIPKIMRLLTSGQIEENCGITIFTNPKGLTIDKLDHLLREEARASFEELAMKGEGLVGLLEKTMYSVIELNLNVNDLSHKSRNIPNAATSMIVISENVFVGSRDRPFNEQRVLVRQNGCEVPNVLEMTSLLIMTYKTTGKRIYSDDPSTFTRCAESLSGWQMGVGSFYETGFFIAHNRFNSKENGIGGVMRNLPQ